MPTITTNLETVKISELAETSSPQGKQTLATNPQTNQSMALDLTAVYEATVNANNAATQAGLAATQARQAAQAADKAREDIQEDLAGKADLDEAKKYVNPSQLDPLYGYQTGAKLDKGYFRTADESLLFTGDRTILAVFVTGNDVTTRQAVFRDGYNNQHNTVSVADNWITGRVGGTSYQAAAQANTLYEVVLVKTADGCKVSVNGVVQNKALAGDAAEARFIEIGNSENVPFFGRIISVRVFNFAFSDTDIAASWNGGHPELWRVLDIWRNIIHSQWPSDGFTASAGTWVQNNSATSITGNVAAANGFSGTFLRATNNTPGNLSIYNAWRLDNKQADMKYMQLIEFEYRSDGAIKAIHGGTVLATFPANTGNAVTASYIAPAGQYTSLSMAGSEGTYLEIRTLRIMTLGCLLDLTPAGLLPTLWRDMSGQGNDVPYVPTSGNPTNVEFSYENVGYSDVLTGIAAPSIAPNFVGQTYIDTQNKNVYKAVGTSSAADWKNI